MKRFLLLALLLVGFADLCSAQTVSLNEIRFGNWTDDDWYNNAYFQQVRTFLNDTETLKAEYPDLQPHLQLLRSPFVVVDAQEAVYGGAVCRFCLSEEPQPLLPSLGLWDSRKQQGDRLRGALPCT